MRPLREGECGRDLRLCRRAVTSPQGGIADKEGNRFEHYRTAWWMARILLEEASSIRLEPPGAVGDGVEFLVEVGDSQWVVQTKDVGRSWSIRSLDRHGLLASMLRHRKAGRR